jgi:hypothetical protein
MKQVSEPNKGFIVIVDADGSVVDHNSNNCVIDDVFDLIRYLDTNFPDGAPHSAWTCNGSFERVKDRL